MQLVINVFLLPFYFIASFSFETLVHIKHVHIKFKYTKELYFELINMRFNVQ